MANSGSDFFGDFLHQIEDQLGDTARSVSDFFDDDGTDGTDDGTYRKGSSHGTRNGSRGGSTRWKWNHVSADGRTIDRGSASVKIRWGHGFLGKWLWILLAILIALVALVVGGANFLTDVLWYSQLGYGSVIWTTVAMKAGLWIVFALLVGLVGFLSAHLAIRSRPADAQGRSYITENGVITEKKSFTSRTARRVAFWGSLIVGALLGGSLLSDWNQLLIAFHAQGFGVTDPQFGLDAGFYVFVLPALHAIIAGLIILAGVGLVVDLVAQFALSGIRVRLPQGGRGLFSLTRRAARQTGVWILLLFLALAAQTALGAFDSLSASSGRITGAAYTQVHASIPACFIMAAALAATGIAIGVWLMTSRRFTVQGDVRAVGWKQAFKAWRVPTIAVAVLAVLALILGTIWPALLQQFVVNPNQQELESTYISRNIAATRRAFGLDRLTARTYKASTNGKAGALASDAETTAQIRLLDPQVVAPTFRQLQQSKQYYSFEDTLAVDKYEIDGKSYDTLIGARELDLDGNDQRNWVNDHTVYTHGYGVVAAYGNKVSADGQPLFFEYGIPTQGALTRSQHYEPRIYFSPNAPEYSIVGHPKTQKNWEFDYPTGSTGATTMFTGDAGPSVGSLWRKILYSLRFNTTQILFSSRVTPDSQILYNRSPLDRVRAVAPYLEFDSRVYPAVVDGRVKWIIDGYTVSDNYPYSQRVDLHTSTQDAITESSQSMRTVTSGQANYMRNSVKATVDAYDGHVDLYAWDASDPVLKAWRSVFPGQYKPVSSISADLMSHLRYPESLFKVQRGLLAKYHVTDAAQFFSAEDFWQTPVDPTIRANESGKSGSASDDALQPPYYLTMQMPGRTSPTFSLSTSYIPAGASTREILTGFLAVDSDAGHKKGVIGPNYGTLRLLELPKDTNVPGPGQAQNNFNANATVSQELNLLESGSTDVVRGNLLTLPIGGGLVYVQPVYVQSNGSTSYPLLKKVLVAFGEHIGFADTLDEALDQVFGGDSGASAGDADNVGGGSAQKKSSDAAADGSSGSNGSSGSDSTDADGSGTGGSGTSGNGSAATSVPKALSEALAEADQAYKDGQDALKKGDFSAYGKAQDRLKDALSRAVEQSGQAGSSK